MKIKRDTYLNKLINRKHNGLIKIVSGLRRCGKSYLLFELFKKHLLNSGVTNSRIITISLDNYEDEKYRNPDECYKYVKSKIKTSKMHYLLLDEVQMMERFEDVLNGFLHIKNLDVYVTGSNSKFLSTDVVTEFRGRGDEIRIYPLSFSEFYSAFPNRDWNEVWSEYCIYGGMPFVLNYTEEVDKIAYLENLFKETYIRDIIERNAIRGDSELEELVNIVASNIGGLTNPQKLSDTFRSLKKLNVASQTIKQYLDYLQDAFVISKALRYDIKGKKYINTPSKYYFADMGLRNARLEFRQNEETHLMENIIFNELVIRGFKVDVGEVSIRSSKNGVQERKTTEIDFVANKGNRRYYIQSALDLSSPEKQLQESRSLLGIKDAFKKIIIVKNNLKPYYNNEGIAIVALKDFLLNVNIFEF